MFITNYQLINSALSLLRKYPEKLSSNIDPAPLAVARGQSASHPLPLIESLQFVEPSTIILMHNDKIAIVGYLHSFLFLILVKDNLRLYSDNVTSAIARLEMCLVMNSISGVRGFCST